MARPGFLLSTAAGLAVGGAIAAVAITREVVVPGSAPTTPRCEAMVPPVRGVTDLNAMVAAFGEFPALQGADLGVSVRLSSTRWLWVFGDTFRKPGVPNGTFARNSILQVDGQCARVVLPPDGGPIIPARGDGVSYWPMSVITVPDKGFTHLYVMAQRIRQDEPTRYGFAHLGPSIAHLIAYDDSEPKHVETLDLGPDDGSVGSPAWGAASYRDGDTIYLYGTARPFDGGAGWGLYAARATLDTLEDRTKWLFWDGTQWQGHEGRMRPVISQQNGVSQVLSVFKRGQSWYAVSKQGDLLGKDLVIWKANSPAGPFTPTVAGNVRSDKRTVYYTPLAHPDIRTDPGRLIVSVSRIPAGPMKVPEDLPHYRPKFLEVDLP